jgi:hypothetical protein
VIIENFEEIKEKDKKKKKKKDKKEKVVEIDINSDQEDAKVIPPQDLVEDLEQI